MPGAPLHADGAQPLGLCALVDCNATGFLLLFPVFPVVKRCAAAPCIVRNRMESKANIQWHMLSVRFKVQPASKGTYYREVLLLMCTCSVQS